MSKAFIHAQEDISRKQTNKTLHLFLVEVKAFEEKRLRVLDS